MAVKMLRAHTVAKGEHHRSRLISLMPGYHGATIHTLGLNGDVNAAALWGPLTVESEKIPAPLTFRATSAEAAAAASLEALEATIQRLGPEQVLALMMEPIGGQCSGVNVPDPSFARGARAICDRHEIALVFDEVVTAFRTGEYLAAHHDRQALPDLVTLAKGLGGGYAPGSARCWRRHRSPTRSPTQPASWCRTPTTPARWRARPAPLCSTRSSSAISSRSLLASGTGSARDSSRSPNSPVVGDVRGRGLLLALELVADRTTSSKFPPGVDPGALLVQRGLEHGLLLYSRRQNGGKFGDWLLVAPPLIIDERTADQIVERLAAVRTATTDALLTGATR